MRQVNEVGSVEALASVSEIAPTCPNPLATALDKLLAARDRYNAAFEEMVNAEGPYEQAETAFINLFEALGNQNVSHVLYGDTIIVFKDCWTDLAESKRLEYKSIIRIPRAGGR